MKDQDNKTVTLTLSFSHPFEGVGMELVKPKSFGVTFEGKTESLLDNLKETKVMDHNSWTADYQLKRPGVYQFAMEPMP